MVASRPSGATGSVTQSFNISATVNSVAVTALSVSPRFSLIDPVPTVTVSALGSDGVDLTKAATPTPISATITTDSQTKIYSGVVRGVSTTTQAPGVDVTSYTMVPAGFLFFTARGNFITTPNATSADTITAIIAAYNAKYPSSKITSSITKAVTSGCVSGVRYIDMTYSEMVISILGVVGVRLRLDFSNNLIAYSTTKRNSTDVSLQSTDYSSASTTINKYARFS